MLQHLLQHAKLKVYANVYSACGHVEILSYFVDTSDSGRPVCPELQQMKEYSYLICDGDKFEEEQCISDTQCFCVDETTGDRIGTLYRTREEISCDRKLAVYLSLFVAVRN